MTPVTSACQPGGGEESLQEKIPLPMPAEVPLDPPERRTKAIAVLIAGGSLSSDKMAYCTRVLPDLSFSAALTAISPLSDLLVFAHVFHHRQQGLLAGCSQGVCCSFPEVLSLK